MKKLFVQLVFTFLLLTSTILPQWQQTFGPFGYTCYVLTSGNGYVFSSGGKLFRSDNNGLSWTEKANGIWQWDITDIYIAGTRVFAITWQDPQSYLYYSDDNGDNWTQINSLSFTGGTIDGIVKCGEKLFLSTYAKGIHVSTDNGETWNKVNGNLPDNSSLHNITAIGSVLFVGSYSGVFKSTNDGITWSLCPNPPNLQEVNYITSNNNKLYIVFGTGAGYATGVYKSTNLGESLEQIFAINNAPYVRKFYAEGDNIYCCTDSGTYKSSNDGVSWTLISFKDEESYSIAKSGGNLIIGTRDFGIFTTTNNGNSWLNTGYFKNIISQTILANGNTVITGDNGQHGVIISRDAGGSFTEMYSLMGFYTNKLYKRGSDLFAGSSSGVFKSADNGNSWTRIGIPYKDIFSFAHYNNYLFAGSFGDGVFRTTNDGLSWTQINGGLSDLRIASMEIIDSTVYAGSYGGVYKSTNKGNNWILSGLTNLQIVSLAKLNNSLFAATPDGLKYMDSQGNWLQSSLTGNISFVTAIGNTLAAGTNSGLSVSKDMGVSWNQIFQNPQNSFVACATSNSESVFIGTWGGGIWKAPLSILTEINETGSFTPVEFGLSQNYPNPFNPVTTISFVLPKQEKIKLTIFDLSGCEIKVLLNETLSAGQHEINFNAAGLRSGVYFYRIESESYKQTKKMIYIK